MARATDERGGLRSDTGGEPVDPPAGGGHRVDERGELRRTDDAYTERAFTWRQLARALAEQGGQPAERGLVRAGAQAGSRWYTWVGVDRRVARRGSPPAAPGSGPGSRRVVRQSGGTGRGRRRRVGRRTREKVPGLGRWTGPHCSLGDGSGADQERTRTAACRSSFILRRRPRLAAPPSPGTASTDALSTCLPSRAFARRRGCPGRGLRNFWVYRSGRCRNGSRAGASLPVPLARCS